MCAALYGILRVMLGTHRRCNMGNVGIAGSIDQCFDSRRIQPHMVHVLQMLSVPASMRSLEGYLAEVPVVLAFNSAPLAGCSEHVHASAMPCSLSAHCFPLVSGRARACV